MVQRVLDRRAVELVPVSGRAGGAARGRSIGGAGRVEGRGGRRRSPGRERFDSPFFAFDLSEDVRQRLDSENIFRQLGQQRQIAGLQTAAAQDVQNTFL